MKDGPDIARVAALIGDPARANMLTALMDGRALTASELAAQAGVTKQTASAHLSKLNDGGLLAREVQGRHHYFRLRDEEVARALEALMGVAQTGSGQRMRIGPRDAPLRKARICYDHLAGELGVLMFDRMKAQGRLQVRDGMVELSANGRKSLAELGAALPDPLHSRRPQCRVCLDWSVRRYHLAGTAGKAVLDRILQLRWARRAPDSRIVAFSDRGMRAFLAWLE